MGKPPRTFSPSFKFDVVLESYIERNVEGTANRHDLHPSVLKDWRKVFRERGSDVFATPQVVRNVRSAEAKKIDELERLIGKLTIQLSALKKSQDFLS